MAFSPLRLATFSLSSTSSKSANILSVSFERAGRPDKRPAASFPPLKRNLNHISLRPLRALLRVGGLGLTLPRRLDLDDLVLLGALRILRSLKHHYALSPDEVLGAPADLGVYLSSDGCCPLISLGLCGGAHAGEADHLGALSCNLEGPHQPVTKLGLFLFDVHQFGVVSAVFEDLLHPYVHAETHYSVSFELFTCNP